MSINPDVVETRKFNSMAVEVKQLAQLEWSELYALDEASMTEFVDVVNQAFATTEAKQLMSVAPLFVEYMLAKQGRIDWGSIALAVDNSNGMYHPLKLTKVVRDTGQ